MGRYIGPMCRLCRREGIKLCDKHKCAGVRRNYPPGMHGGERQGKKSDYAKQLREKQKARRIFGVSEKQIQRYYAKAIASKEESGAELLRQLEQRFDNIIYRCGFASTRRQARQLVGHGIFLVNGKRANIPSLELKGGDVFEVLPQKKSMLLFENFAKRNINLPIWLSVNSQELKGHLLSQPGKEHLEASINAQMIIEFYSR